MSNEDPARRVVLTEKEIDALYEIDETMREIAKILSDPNTTRADFVTAIKAVWSDATFLVETVTGQPWFATAAICATCEGSGAGLNGPCTSCRGHGFARVQR